jgi:hypothetical protein
MQKILPLFGEALGDRAVLAQAGVNGGLSITGTFDIHLARLSENTVALIVRSASSDGYSAGVDIRIGTEILQDLTKGEHRYATRRAEKRLNFNPFSATIAAGSRDGGATVYHVFDLARPEHRNAFDRIWAGARGPMPMVPTNHDVRNALGTLSSELEGGARSTAEAHGARASAATASAADTLVFAVRHAGDSFTQQVGAHIPFVAKLDGHSVVRFDKYCMDDRSSGLLIHSSNAEIQSGRGERFLMGFGGEGEFLQRSFVRCASPDPDTVTIRGMSQIGREFRFNANRVDVDDISKVTGEFALRLGPALFSVIGPKIETALATAQASGKVVAVEVNVSLTERGVASLMNQLLRHVKIDPARGEMILTSFLRTKLDEYLGVLDRVRMFDPEKTAGLAFRPRETTIFDAFFGGGDGTQQSIKKIAAFFAEMIPCWRRTSEERREEMISELAALLHRDTILKQVGVGFLGFIAEDYGSLSPTDLYHVTFWDRVAQGNSGLLPTGAPSSTDAAVMDQGRLLAQRGDGAAFDFMRRFIPSMQPPTPSMPHTLPVTTPSLSTEPRLDINYPISLNPGPIQPPPLPVPRAIPLMESGEE